jgi:hypothetical protein
MRVDNSPLDPTQIKIFDVFNDLVKRWRGVPQRAYVDPCFLNGGEVLPRPIQALKSFFALELFEPAQ